MKTETANKGLMDKTRRPTLEMPLKHCDAFKFASEQDCSFRPHKTIKMNWAGYECTSWANQRLLNLLILFTCFHRRRKNGGFQPEEMAVLSQQEHLNRVQNGVAPAASSPGLLDDPYSGAVLNLSGLLGGAGKPRNTIKCAHVHKYTSLPI